MTMTDALQHPDSKAGIFSSGTAAGNRTANPEAFDARTMVFQQLRPYTSQLLQSRGSPPRLQALLQRLKTVIKDADAAGLNCHGCMDYILFPLMFGVDSIAVTRRPGECSCAR